MMDSPHGKSSAAAGRLSANFLTVFQRRAVIEEWGFLARDSLTPCPPVSGKKKNARFPRVREPRGTLDGE